MREKGKTGALLIPIVADSERRGFSSSKVNSEKYNYLYFSIGNSCKDSFYQKCQKLHSFYRGSRATGEPLNLPLGDQAKLILSRSGTI